MHSSLSGKISNNAQIEFNISKFVELFKYNDDLDLINSELKKPKCSESLARQLILITLPGTLTPILPFFLLNLINPE